MGKSVGAWWGFWGLALVAAGGGCSSDPSSATSSSAATTGSGTGGSSAATTSGGIGGSSNPTSSSAVTSSSGTGGPGGGGAGGGNGTVVLSGPIGATPLVISDPAIDPSSPSLIAVYWSDDGGSTWYSEYTRCAVTSGSSTASRSFLMSKGKLVLTQNYCTHAATHYQVVIESGATLLQGPINVFKTILSPLFNAQSLPKLSVMWSEDGGASWYSDYTQCAVSAGSSTATRTFQIENGKLTLPESYCTEGATHYRVAVKPNAAHLGGSALPRPLNVAVPGLSASALGFLSVYWSEDGGTSWYSEYTECAVMAGSSATSRSFLLSNGQLTLTKNYCTEKGTLYQVAK